MKTSPFDFINIINNKDSDKKSIIEVKEEEYTPYIVNRFFSFFPESIFFANELNRWSASRNLSNKQQFDFYYNFLPKKKRYTKWLKPLIEKEDEEKVNLIVGYYQCSRREANQMLIIIKNETQQKQQQIFENLKSGVSKGGKTNEQ
jgi:hypothetical protein